MLRIYLVLVTFLLSCNSQEDKNPHVLIDASLGEIELELYPDKAPKTVAAFLAYIDSGYYKDASFYRVLKHDDEPVETNVGVIQGGIWQTNPQKKIQLKGLTHESTRLTGLTHSEGTISLARSDTGTATSEFFICIGDQSPFDAGRRGTADSLGFAAFGKVVKGMSVVRKIQSQPSQGDKFDNKILFSIKRL